MAKKSEAQAILGAIPEGGYAVSASGGTRIVRGSGDDASGYRWVSGKTDAPAEEELILRRLMSVKSDLLSGWKVISPEEAADYERERAARDDKVRERVGLRKGAQNGSASKKTAELPRGFALGTGSDLAPGDLVVTDAERGPERVVSVGSGGVSRGREYLKLMLEPIEGDGDGKAEARRRFVSPRKEYPIKKSPAPEKVGA